MIMDTKKAIRTALDTAHNILCGYLEDLSEEETGMRPVPEANHITWQLGHLIASENKAMEGIKPGISPKLPEGFAECYKSDNCGLDDPSKFHTKETLVGLMNGQREATVKILNELSDSDLDQPGPESMRSFAPTVGDALLMQSTHQLMHAGQVAVLRRKLNKPIVF